jgi:hypothetical protein
MGDGIDHGVGHADSDAGDGHVKEVVGGSLNLNSRKQWVVLH